MSSGRRVCTPLLPVLVLFVQDGAAMLQCATSRLALSGFAPSLASADVRPIPSVTLPERSAPSAPRSRPDHNARRSGHSIDGVNHPVDHDHDHNRVRSPSTLRSSTARFLLQPESPQAAVCLLPPGSPAHPVNYPTPGNSSSPSRRHHTIHLARQESAAFTRGYSTGQDLHNNKICSLTAQDLSLFSSPRLSSPSSRPCKHPDVVSKKCAPRPNPTPPHPNFNENNIYNNSDNQRSTSHHPYLMMAPPKTTREQIPGNPTTSLLLRGRSSTTTLPIPIPQRHRHRCPNSRRCRSSSAECFVVQYLESPRRITGSGPLAHYGLMPMTGPPPPQVGSQLL